ncbi:MAG: D-sedoheptulose 7-phosphate isomerase [Succinivibrionaceae bacterium]|nr:D-sedoheptulose 7-phosphate isomerase [Succinivibrionaceae bacterium]MDY6376520.1 D-sedoheptulose 7-phosphate isomerase [Succinivibrionaceae bacterium]
MFSIKEYIQASIDTKQKILQDEGIQEKIRSAALAMVSAIRNGHKVLSAGNGGSAADAQHFAGELVSKFFFDRPGLPAFSLATDTSVLTAIGNDYGYEHSFERQVQAVGQKGDVFLGISTSGNSKNIVAAVLEAKKKGIMTVALTGAKDCALDTLCDTVIKVPSLSTPTIQESHIMIEHMICAIVEDEIFGERK